MQARPRGAQTTKRRGESARDIAAARWETFWLRAGDASKRVARRRLLLLLVATAQQRDAGESAADQRERGGLGNRRGQVFAAVAVVAIPVAIAAAAVAVLAGVTVAGTGAVVTAARIDRGRGRVR